MPAGYEATRSFPSCTDLLWKFRQFAGLSASPFEICHLTLETSSEQYDIAWPVRA